MSRSGRPPRPVGTWGEIFFNEKPNGKFTAKAWYRGFDGRSKLVEATGHSKSNARNILTQRLRDKSTSSGDEALTEQSTVDQLAALWIQSVKDSSLSQATKDAYEDMVCAATETKSQGHITRVLGGRRLHEVTPGICERFVHGLTASKGPSTAKRARFCLKQMFRMAVQFDAVPRNPVTETNTVKETPKETRALTADEIKQLFTIVYSSRRAIELDLPDMLIFMLGTGARIGETLAVRWQDLDLNPQSPSVSINGTVKRIRGEGLIRQPHTKTRTRDNVKIPADWLVKNLQARKDRLIMNNVHDVVFPSLVGTLRDDCNVRKSLNDLINPHGFEWVTPHTFRRTVATFTANVMDIETAARQLSHTNSAMTKRYVQETRGAIDSRKALNALGDALPTGMAFE